MIYAHALDFDCQDEILRLRTELSAQTCEVGERILVSIRIRQRGVIFDFGEITPLCRLYFSSYVAGLQCSSSSCLERFEIYSLKKVQETEKNL